MIEPSCTLLYDTKYVNHFYRLPEAMTLFDDYVRTLVRRRNAFTGAAYASDPTIMAWEIANAPRGGRTPVAEYSSWVRRVARLLKSLDRNHLVTLGSEGTGGSGPFRQDFEASDIDFTSAHIWPEHFKWFSVDAEPGGPNGITNAITRMQAYMGAHCQWTEALGKPLVIEAFGMSRDLALLDPAAPVSNRDKFFAAVLESALSLMQGGRSLAGISFWAWGGEGRAPARPPDSGEGWREGDPFVGDAPSELQGLLSVYNSDATTCALIKRFAQRVNLP